MWSFFSRDPTKEFPYEGQDEQPQPPPQSLQGGQGGQGAAAPEHSVWRVQRGRKKNGGEEVSLFVFEGGAGGAGGQAQAEVARAGLKKMKSLRHPSVVHFLDSCDTERAILLATEAVTPLHQHLAALGPDRAQRELHSAWGLFQITRALSFLINDCKTNHNNVCMYSVFVTISGEWKLGGFEYSTPVVQDGAPQLPVKIFPSLDVYDPPEKRDPTKLKSMTKCSSDMWGLGCLIWETFNGPLKQQSNLKILDAIPKQLSSLYCELVSANPSSRPNPADIITRCRKPGGFFKNDLVDTLLFLEEIQIKDKTEKNRFFSSLSSHLDNFPEGVCVHKILPQLLMAFQYGDAGSAVLSPMFKLGRLLSDADYQKQILPCVIELFASNDRTTRSRLLQQLDLFISHIPNGTVNDQIFPQVVHGFMDTNPIIREQTVKSIVHLAPKLNYNNLNVEVLKHFARLQSKDDQGGIRTNTTVCLGKIAQHLHPQIRQKVLISAFVRATRDPFPPARQAGVLALAATQQYFLLSEVALRILPALCPLAIDPEKQVRDSVFRTIRGFLGKLEKVSEDPSLKEDMEADVHTATPSLSNAAATWAGWAVTAVTAKFYRSHSDTAGRPHQGTPKLTSKPASLEQPSSSSISTTTSSVTSMTSLEHSESASDYDPEHWEMGGQWGEIGSGSSSPPQQLPHSSTGVPLEALCETDGWDNEEWGTLEEEPSAAASLTSPSETWGPNANWSDDTPIKNTDNNGTEKSNLINNEEPTSGWEENEFEPIEDTAANSKKLEEMRRKREERKLQRQLQLESKRNARAQLGPMKLAAKKAPPF